MRIRFTGDGVLITGDPTKGFRAIGRGMIGDLTEDRAKHLVTLGVASLDLEEDLNELTALEPEVLVDPEQLSRTTKRYNATHHAVVVALELAQASRDQLEAMGVKK